MATLLNNIPNNITEYPNSFKRQGAFPLERYSVFSSYAEAKDYAENNKIAYVTQPIGVAYKIGEEIIADYYIIGDEKGTLIHIGNSNHNLDEINARLEEIEQFFALEDGESLKETLDQLIELQKWIEEHLGDFEEFKEQTRVDLETETRNRTIQDKYLSEAISAESTRATEAEEALRTSISQNANAINNEQVLREEADTGLSMIINTEKTDRQRQYSELQTALGEEINRAIGEERQISQGLNNAVTQLNALKERCILETAERVNAINKLDSDITKKLNAEMINRIEADELLQSEIETESTTREEEVESLRTALAEEAYIARGAENELGRRLTGEEKTRMNEDLAIMVALNNEKQERQEDNARLNKLIEEETKRANDEDKKLIELIDKEEKARDDADKEIAKIIKGLTEEDILLKSNLYTYVPIGNAQKASNEVINKNGNTISVTNRGLIGEAGQSLKKVFDNIFGTEADVSPKVDTNSAKLTKQSPTKSYGGGEYGAVVSEDTIDVTFTLANSGTAEYGYKWGDADNEKTTSKNAVFYYPINQQSTDNPLDDEEKADIKIVLPLSVNSIEDVTIEEIDYKKLTSTSEGKTIIVKVLSANYVGCYGQNLYCNLSNKSVQIAVTLPEWDNTDARTRYGKITAYVDLGKPQNSQEKEITKFLTYLENQGKTASTTAPTPTEKGTVSAETSVYTITKGSYYKYYLASTSNSLSNNTNNPVTNATQFSSTSVSINCTEASHIWFLLPPGTTGSKSIQYEPFANTWVNAFGGEEDKTIGPINVALELNSGTVVMYSGYYTSAKASAGSKMNYKIV